MMPVRWLTSRSRTRCSACRSSCSAVFVATNFIVGRCTASAMASASRKSFFCPFEYGRTYRAGINRASWPSFWSPRLRWCAPTQASMPIRHGGIFENRASTWPRDHFCRSTMAPCSSRPTTWNEFLPMSMPTKAIECLGASAFGAPRKHLLLVGQERTIPLPDAASFGPNCLTPSDKGVHFVHIQIRPLYCRDSDRIIVICYDRLQTGLGVGITERVGEPLLVAPCPLAVFQPRIDLTRLIVSEIDYRNQASTSFQKFDVTLRCQVLIDINLLGLLSANINILEPVNIEHAFDVQDPHFSVATKCHCPWSVTFRDAIVEKLVVDALSGNERPGEKQFRHARVGFDIMSQKILNCLVPADFQSSLPSTFYGQFWRCNHKKHHCCPVQRWWF